MGLFDGFNPDMLNDPTTMGMFAASEYFGTPMSSRPTIGGGLGAFTKARQYMLDNQRKGKEFELEQQVKQMQLDEAKRKLAEQLGQQKFLEGADKYYQSPESQAIGAFGPTPAGAAAIPMLSPKFDQSSFARDMLRVPGMAPTALGMLAKDEAPIQLAGDAKLVDKRGREIASNPKAQAPHNGYLIPDGKGGWKIDPVLFKAEKELKETSAPKVTVSTPVKVGNEFGTGVADWAAKSLTGQIDAARTAPATISNAQQILTALDTGKVISGPGTKWRITAQQLFGNDPAKLDATRTAIMGLAKLSLDSRQSLKGQGSITEPEQKMLSDAVSGKIDELTTGEIRLIVTGAIKNAATAYKLGSRASAALSANPNLKGVAPAFELPPMPTGTQTVDDLVRMYSGSN